MKQKSKSKRPKFVLKIHGRTEDGGFIAIALTEAEIKMLKGK